MEYQWRSRPMQGPQICPVCAVYHFPFCPPPPAPLPYPQNPSFPFEPDYLRPGLDLYRGPMVPTPGYADPSNWQRDHHSYGQFQHHPHGAGNGYAGEGDRSYKRLRINEFGSGAGGFTGEGYPNLGWISSEDERRLKLIRDHGGASASGPMAPAPPASSFRGAIGDIGRGEENGFGYGNRELPDVQSRDHMPGREPRYAQMNNCHASYHEYRDSIPNKLFAQDGHQIFSGIAPFGASQGAYVPMLNGGSGGGVGGYESKGNTDVSRVFGGQPPLPPSPPPPLPMEPSVQPPQPEFKAFHAPLKPVSTLFPVAVSSNAYPSAAESHSLAQPFLKGKSPQLSAGFVMEEPPALNRTSSKLFAGEVQPFSQHKSSPDKPKIIDAAHLFKLPQRATRPDHFVIILRGLPGSGKSYLAKMLRDIEVENGGDAPRIHSMDDYFMTEVEKEDEENETSSSLRGKKSVTRKVMEYCYEPEMEEAYRSSMLKAFKKTLDDGIFTFVIVDDRNLRVADFAQYWATAKRSGYEVYILEAPYRDPVGCAARNVHGFIQDDIQEMAKQWEEAPAMYLQLDIKSLFHGDDLNGGGIQEVDMDTEGDFNESISGYQEKKTEKMVAPALGDDATNDSPKGKRRWDAEGEHLTDVKDLGRSKWSEDLDDDAAVKPEGVKDKANSLAGLVQAYGKEAKSVRWGDQVGPTGFSIAAAKKARMPSLVIGPGAGYNLKSNPLPQGESDKVAKYTGESKKQSTFQERLRAERESFKAIFDKRRQRIGGLDVED